METGNHHPEHHDPDDVGEHVAHHLIQEAIFDPAILDTPRIDAAFTAQQSATQGWQVEVKRRGAISLITYPFNPLDVVGWHGDREFTQAVYFVDEFPTAELGKVSKKDLRELADSYLEP